MREKREVNIGPASAFGDPGRKVIEIDGVEVGVFKVQGEFRAWLNVCPHFGGPVCQGRIIPKVDEDIADDGKSRGLVFSTTKVNIVCPWHAYEFDILTGRHHGNSRVRLRPVELKLVDGDVILMLPDRSANVDPVGESGESRPTA